MYIPCAVCSKNLPLDLLQGYLLYRDCASTGAPKAWYGSSFKLQGPVHTLLFVFINFEHVESRLFLGFYLFSQVYG